MSKTCGSAFGLSTGEGSSIHLAGYMIRSNKVQRKLGLKRYPSSLTQPFTQNYGTTHERVSRKYDIGEYLPCCSQSRPYNQTLANFSAQKVRRMRTCCLSLPGCCAFVPLTVSSCRRRRKAGPPSGEVMITPPGSLQKRTKLSTGWCCPPRPRRNEHASTGLSKSFRKTVAPADRAETLSTGSLPKRAEFATIPVFAESKTE